MSENLICLYQTSIGCSIEDLAREILKLATTVSPNSEISYRIKDQRILVRKMSLKNVRSVFDIDDVYGLRLLVSSVEESYDVLNVIGRFFRYVLDHDYIKEPKIRLDKPHLAGKSLRLIQIIAYRNGVRFEIQITTFDFDEENESLHGQYHDEKYPYISNGNT